MPNYNLTYMDYQTSFTGLVDGLNTATGNWFFGLVLLVAWVILFLVFYNKTDTANLLIGSGFIFSVLTGFAMAAQVVPVWIVGIPLTITAAGIAFKFMGGR